MKWIWIQKKNKNKKWKKVEATTITTKWRKEREKTHKQRKHTIEVRICHTYSPNLRHFFPYSPTMSTWKVKKLWKWQQNKWKNKKEKCKNHSSWFFDSVICALPSLFKRNPKCMLKMKWIQEKKNKVNSSLCIFDHKKNSATNNQMNTKCFLSVFNKYYL